MPIGHFERQFPERIVSPAHRADAGFRTTLAEKFNEVQHLRWRLRFIKAIVIADDGRIFKAKVDKQIQRELTKARKTQKAWIMYELRLQAACRVTK